MSLQPGQKLGAYEIVTQAGVGGMGEVYKALDSRLDRTVAIKVLPEGLASSPELQERFNREAKAISSLSHPNICTLYDIGHEDGRDFLVMEFLEGETLAERLAKEPMPTGEVLKVAIQIADALDSAHRQGLIHRDLKPGNVMLTRDGAKLLDFGLAKLAVPDEQPDPMSGMTMTSPLTMDGSLIGTMQYMSPEQLEGKEADARSDIFAFGALLYEMTTGKRPFDGSSQASLIASILKVDPVAASTIQPMVPPMLDQAIGHCLDKDPENRWQTAGDLKRALTWVAEGGSQIGVPAPVSRRRQKRERVQWTVITGLFVITAALGGLLWKQGQYKPPVVRSTIEVTQPVVMHNMGSGSVEISPDGQKVVYTAADSTGATVRLWVRSLNALVAQPVPGTEGARFPFWSPDGRYIGYFAKNKLKKVLATGGPSLALCTVVDGRGGSWNQDGVILFSPDSQAGLYRVSAAGGEPHAVTSLDSTSVDRSHRWPHFLPNGRDFLFFARTGNSTGLDTDAICVGSLGQPEFRRILPSTSNPRYSNGHILFFRDGILMAQPFDTKKLEFTGDAVPLPDSVAYVHGWARGAYSTSQDGSLVYRYGNINAGSVLQFYDLAGNKLEDITDLRLQFSMRISHDQSRVVLNITDEASANTDLWIHDRTRGIESRLTFTAGLDYTPAWSPNDSLIAFSSRRIEQPGIYIKSTNGAGAADLLWATSGDPRISDWSRDARYIFCSINESSNTQIWVVPLNKAEEPFKFQANSFNQWDPSLSPDGRWLAYTSDESGSEEVYVTSFPGPSGKWQISNHEGDRPRWTADGKRLFYLNNSDQINVVDIDGSGVALKVGQAKILFAIKATRPGNIYDISDDGQSLLVNTRVGVHIESKMVLVQNWEQELLRTQ